MRKKATCYNTNLRKKNEKFDQFDLDKMIWIAFDQIIGSIFVCNAYIMREMNKKLIRNKQYMNIYGL